MFRHASVFKLLSQTSQWIWQFPHITLNSRLLSAANCRKQLTKNSRMKWIWLTKLSLKSWWKATIQGGFSPSRFRHTTLQKILTGITKISKGFGKWLQNTVSLTFQTSLIQICLRKMHVQCAAAWELTTANLNTAAAGFSGQILWPVRSALWQLTFQKLQKIQLQKAISLNSLQEKWKLQKKVWKSNVRFWKITQTKICIRIQNSICAISRHVSEFTGKTTSQQSGLSAWTRLVWTF